jgi:hypothetical protein
MSDQESSTPPSQRFKVYQSKAHFFRVVHADGVWCSVNAYRNFNLTFYNERHPIPQSIYFNLDEKGNSLEDITAREGKEGWFRELEVNVVMSLHGAKLLRGALDHYIGILEKQIEDEVKAPDA